MRQKKSAFSDVALSQNVIARVWARMGHVTFFFHQQNNLGSLSGFAWFVRGDFVFIRDVRYNRYYSLCRDFLVSSGFQIVTSHMEVSPAEQSRQQDLYNSELAERTAYYIAQQQIKDAKKKARTSSKK